MTDVQKINKKLYNLWTFTSYTYNVFILCIQCSYIVNMDFVYCVLCNIGLKNILNKNELINIFTEVQIQLNQKIKLQLNLNKAV